MGSGASYHPRPTHKPNGIIGAQAMCGIVDATILSVRKQADKRESRLVTAQVLRLLDERSEAKKELFAVKGRTRRTPLTRSLRSIHYPA